MKQFTLLILIIISLSGFSQEKELKEYLSAYSTLEFDESKEIVKKLSFSLNSNFILSEYSSIKGMMFNTDLDSIKGYKAIVSCKLENQAGNLIDKRMFVLMFKDKKINVWKVFAFRESVDPKKEYNSLKTAVENNDFYTK